MSLDSIIYSININGTYCTSKALGPGFIYLFKHYLSIHFYM